MIITRAPFRMSFFGGGTDYPPFFQEHGGSVLSTTFDKYAYVTVRHLPGFFDYKTQVSYSKIEYVKHVDELEHPLVREAMKYLDMHRLHIAYDADLPARSGLGSSSAFAAALMSAFHALKGQYISPKQLAKECILWSGRSVRRTVDGRTKLHPAMADLIGSISMRMNLMLPQ